MRPLGGQRVDVLAHGGEAEVGAVGDQGGEQRAVWVAAAGLVAAERLESSRGAAPLVNVLQEILDADASEAGPDRGAQLAQRAGGPAWRRVA